MLSQEMIDALNALFWTWFGIPAVFILICMAIVKLRELLGFQS